LVLRKESGWKAARKESLWKIVLPLFGCFVSKKGKYHHLVGPTLKTFLPAKRRKCEMSFQYGEMTT